MLSYQTFKILITGPFLNNFEHVLVKKILGDIQTRSAIMKRESVKKQSLTQNSWNNIGKYLLPREKYFTKPLYVD